MWHYGSNLWELRTSKFGSSWGVFLCVAPLTMFERIFGSLIATGGTFDGPPWPTDGGSIVIKVKG